MKTPKDAEEFLRQKGTGETYIPWIALSMEQYAEAKVLEALEAHRSKYCHTKEDVIKAYDAGIAEAFKANWVEVLSEQYYKEQHEQK